MDTSTRETYNIGRTHISTHTKYNSDACKTQKWRSTTHQQQSRARSIDAQNYSNSPNNPRTQKTSQNHHTQNQKSTRLQYINHEDLPLGKHTTNETSTSYISLEIAVALKQANTEDFMNLLTDNSFCMNTIRNYAIDLAAYNNHLQKDLLQLTNQLLKDRDSEQLKTHIGKVKIAYGCGIQRNGR